MNQLHIGCVTQWQIHALTCPPSLSLLAPFFPWYPVIKVSFLGAGGVDSCNSISWLMRGAGRAGPWGSFMGKEMQ